MLRRWYVRLRAGVAVVPLGAAQAIAIFQYDEGTPAGAFEAHDLVSGG